MDASTIAAPAQSDERAQRTGQRLVTILAEDGPGCLSIAATSLRPADVAAAFESLDDKQRRDLFIALPPEFASQVLEELRPQSRDHLLAESDDEHLAKVLSESSADDAVYFLDHLDDDRAQHLLSKLEDQLRNQIGEQYELPDRSAGRLMKRDVVTLRSFMTAAQAIDRLRANGSTAPSALYVIDADGRLVGVLAFRQLVFAPPGTLVSALMDRDPLTVRPETDKEEVARILQKYHLLAVPVVDDKNRIHGVVTWDDAVEVLEAAAEADLLSIAGTSERSADNETTLRRAWLRLPWLTITAIGGFINANVIAAAGAGLEKQMILVGFMPLVGAMGGNIGLQCSTVTVRGLATGAIGPGSLMASAVREVSTGILLALAMAVVCGLGAAGVALVQHQPATLGLLVGISLFLAVLLAAGLGVIIPLACTRFRIDPALAAGPFITMLNDVSGYAIYIATVNALLRVL